MPKSFTEDGASGAADAGIGPNVAGSDTATPSTDVAGTPAASSGFLAYSPPAASSSGNGGSSTDTGFNELMPATNYYARAAEANMHGQGLFFDDGGAVPDPSDPSSSQDTTNPMGSFDPTNALQVVDQALTYGRQLHGLGGSDGAVPDNQASNMPAMPGTPSKSGVRTQPTPGALPPTNNPFGKRMASNMPTTPGTQSDSGIRPAQPMPGPLPPTSNPFGKRADAGIDDDQEDDTDVDG